MQVFSNNTLMNQHWDVIQVRRYIKDSQSRSQTETRTCKQIFIHKSSAEAHSALLKGKRGGFLLSLQLRIISVHQRHTLLLIQG